MRKDEQVREVLDTFTYILGRGLSYPSPQGETLDSVFADLLSGVELCIKGTHGEDSRRLLEISRQEAEQAYRRFAAGDLLGGSSLIQQAEDHFRGGVSGRKVRATFVAGPDGVERKGP